MSHILVGLLALCGAASLVFTAPAEAGVIIWRPSGFNTAIDLLNAGNRDPGVLARYSNCLVEDGTRIQIQSSSSNQGTADVLVVEGPQAGCRGRIPIEYLTRLRLN